MLVGLKAIEHFERRQEPVAFTYDRLGQIPSATEASLINDQLLAMFLSETVDRIELIYSKFVSLIKAYPVIQTLLPIAPQGLEVIDDEIFRLTTRDRQLYVERRKIAPQVTIPSPAMLFEQNAQQLLDALLPLYLNNQLLRALQEAAASELAARLRATTTASENASELIEQLTLAYNKARQAAITEEILEVVSGAQALKDYR